MMTTTNPKYYSELIAVFNFSLINGLLGKEEVIKWADEIISKDSQPDIFFIELSLCGQKEINYIVAILNEYIEHEKTILVERVILGILHRQYLEGFITLRKVVDTLSRIVWNSVLTDEEKGFMYGLDDDYDCAIKGIFGSVEFIEKETLRFLEIYKDFKVENYMDWNSIDMTIGNKIKELSENVRKEQKD